MSGTLGMAWDARLGSDACVMTALEGLEFSCLADFEICPEYMIAE